MGAPPVLVGTSGFSYDDWRGRWYAPGLAKGRMLEAYAEVFRVLEVNATYYRTPGRRTAESMVERAGGRLEFCVKAPGEVTHQRRLDGAVTLPFLRFLEPFQERGLLTAVLLQFPAAFREGPGAWEHLERVGTELRYLPLAVEMRHGSWDTAEADGRLGEMGMSRVAVDQPSLEGLSAAGRVALTGPLAYFRFHGRNAAQWHARENASDRYRHAYTDEELRPWVPLIREAAERATTTVAFFNNHPDGAAPRDAERLAAMLGTELRGTGYHDLFG